MSAPRMLRRAVAAGAVALLAATAAPLPSALADPVYPSQQDVDDAKAQTRSTAEQVARAESRLAVAAAELDAVQVAAAMAAEDAHEAQVAAEVAVADAERARQQAAAAEAEVVTARGDIARMAARSYRNGGDLGGLEVFVGAAQPQDVLDRAAALEFAGTQQQRSFQRVDATQVVSSMMRERAAGAAVRQERAAGLAEAAQEAAQARAGQAAEQVEQVRRTREGLVADLAELRQTSVALETERQEGLEAERRRREEAAAREAAERTAREQAAAAAAQEAERAAAADRARAAERSRDAERARAAQEPAQEGPARPAPRPTAEDRPAAPAPEPPSPPASSGSGAARDAVDWAMAQIGKPYQWGATGPDRFDCSGLTSSAWRSGGGRSIPRVSRDQYRSLAKVSLDSLRPGDLVFYGTDPSSASSVYHVGMYIGDGQMVEAPYTGADVRVSSIYRSALMPYGTRP